MDDDFLRKMVAAHADHLAAGDVDAAKALQDLPLHGDADLEPLLALSEAVSRLFEPVHRPNPAFREALKRELLAAYQERRGSFWESTSARTLAAVGVGGAVAVAGLIAYWRVRHLPPAV